MASPLTKIMSLKENNDYAHEVTCSTPISPPPSSFVSLSAKTNMQTDNNDHNHHHNLKVKNRGGLRGRRSLLQILCSMSTIIPLVASSDASSHVALALAGDESVSISSSTTTIGMNDDDFRQLLPKMVTNKVYMDVRISRADGTFSVRDHKDGNDEDPFYGRLIIGLFGKRTPNHVQQFLKYVTNGESYDVNNPLPSYSTSKFPLLDTSSGLLIGGKVCEGEDPPQTLDLQLALEISSISHTSFDVVTIYLSRFQDWK